MSPQGHKFSCIPGLGLFFSHLPVTPAPWPGGGVCSAQPLAPFQALIVLSPGVLEPSARGRGLWGHPSLSTSLSWGPRARGRLQRPPTPGNRRQADGFLAVRKCHGPPWLSSSTGRAEMTKKWCLSSESQSGPRSCMPPLKKAAGAGVGGSCKGTSNSENYPPE